jgi:transcription antitermination protein NusB
MEKTCDKSSKPISRRDLRALAFHLFYAVDRFDYAISIDDVVKDFADGFDLQIPDDSHAIFMAKGAVEMRNEIDEQIKPLLKNWKIERLGCCTLLILRLALWELRQSDAIPSVIINEAIELAKCYAEKDAYKFINGILDEACKQMGLADQLEVKAEVKEESSTEEQVDISDEKSVEEQE